jgi:hypothetical protein
VAFISSAFTAGQTLTAASMEALRENSNAGHNVFTNEAARDAAITAPTEGMMAYLTAPTVPAATGTTTMVPTGITTIYNGSAWVCVTPIHAEANTQSDRSGASSNTYDNLSSGGAQPLVTLSTGTTALVTVSCYIILNATEGGYVSVAVSGATTQAASDDKAASLYIGAATGGEAVVSATSVLTGLTAGANTFTLRYRTNTGGATVEFKQRRITVQGIA